MSLPLANTNNIVEPSIRARVVRPMCVCYIQTSHSLCTGGDSHLRKGRVGVLLLIPAAIIFLMAHTARTQSRSSAAKPGAAKKKSSGPGKPSQRPSPAASQWAEATLRKMTVDEKIGSHLAECGLGPLRSRGRGSLRRFARPRGFFLGCAWFRSRRAALCSSSVGHKKNDCGGNQ